MTALDLNMGYYTIRLDAKASEICTIIFPWRKYSYNRLPMGFGGSADIFQAQMMDLMASLDYVRAYIDDLLIMTRGTLDDHILKIETVLTRLCDAGLKVNAAKSFVLYPRNRIPRLYIDKRRDQTPEKEGTGNYCAKSA